MQFEKLKYIYLVGIGGIGMSALARYFHAIGATVHGYDRTPSALTEQLQASGIKITFEDAISTLNSVFVEPSDFNLIIYTPAIPANSQLLNYFKNKQFNLQKRAQILGELTKAKKTIAIAGTHGKTTITTATAHLMHQANKNSSAFLGGIAKNYGSNLILPKATAQGEEIVVVEADEFDRSFLTLHPNIAVITSVDADHLDIYSSKNKIQEAFIQFINQIDEDGILIIKKGIDLELPNHPKNIFTYSFEEEADFYATNIRLKNAKYTFDLITPQGTMKDIQPGIPGDFNAHNAIAAIAVAYFSGVDEETIKDSIHDYSGVQRRFDFQINADSLIYIDDYAHHPQELTSFIGSVRKLFTGKRITGIFQPHLFTRTRDLADEFAKSLELLDELILMDIYPAREEPIEGVDAKMLLDKVNLKEKRIGTKEELLPYLSAKKLDVLLTMGAGDIDKLVNPIKEQLNQNK